jgi:hypothetical protein
MIRIACCSAVIKVPTRKQGSTNAVLTALVKTWGASKRVMAGGWEGAKPISSGRVQIKET